MSARAKAGVRQPLVAVGHRGGVAEARGEHA